MQSIDNEQDVERVVRDPQMVRILDMVLYLVQNQAGVTRKELAEQYGVSRYTIYRDLARMEKIAPISTTESGKIYISRKDYQVNVRLTLHEAMAVHLAGRLLATRMDRRNRHAASALTKLSLAVEKLAPPVSQQMRLSARMLEAADQWSDPAYIEVLEILTEGWASGHKVRVFHPSERSGKLHEYIFLPYFIEPYAIGQSTHVVGVIEPDGRLWTFKVERIQRAELMKEGYSVPVDFDAQALLGDAWGIWFTQNSPVEVSLRFSPKVARRVKESRWHRSQQVEEAEGGALIWRAKVAEWREMLPWIRGWGAEVEVLGPEDLRSEVAQDAQKLAEQYHNLG
jgi:CRISPR-associated endonuclease/helicase Cas3